MDLVKNNYTLDISLFGRAPIKETNGEMYFDYADPYAVSIYPAIHKIYTDNSATVERCIENNGFEKTKFIIEYQPSKEEIKPYHSKLSHRPYHILWASRVATPKNPELLKQIAEKLNPKDFQIDMYGTMGDGYTPHEFEAIPSIKYRGTYNGIESIDTDEYDIYLYTSLMDGMPNAILEAAACGLPIIASDAGGIRDFIKDKKTGILIDDYKNSNSYVEAIKSLASNPKAAEKYARAAQELLKSQHSEAAYLESLKKHFNGGKNES